MREFSQIRLSSDNILFKNLFRQNPILHRVGVENPFSLRAFRSSARNSYCSKLFCSMNIKVPPVSHRA